MISVKVNSGHVHVRKMNGDLESIIEDLICIARCMHDLICEADEEMAQEFRTVLAKVIADDEVWTLPNDCMEDEDEEE